MEPENALPSKGRRLVFDIETNGFIQQVTRCHCLWILDVDTGETTGFTQANLQDGLKELQQASLLIGHNIIGYDLPVLRKLYPWWTTEARLYDTMIASRMAFPDMDDSDWEYASGERDLWADLKEQRLIGSHSLKSWGVRLGFLKGDYGDTTDWAQWTPEMHEYCKRDVELTFLLYGHLNGQELNQEALRIEQEVARIVHRQEQFGWDFDVNGAWHLYGRLLDEKAKLLEQLQEMFPPWLAPDGKPKDIKKPYKRKGIHVMGPYTKLKLVEFNPNSRAQIAYWLKRRHHWQPTEFTAPSKTFPQGQPKVDEEVLSGLPWPEAALIARYMLLEKRVGQVATGQAAWLKLVRPNGRIYGSVLTVGCVTRRMAHSKPNLAQVPRVTSPFGPECRALFRAPPGKVLVGADASGLEARVQAHYQRPYDGGALMDTILKGNKEDQTSIHYVNMRAFELNSGNPKQDYDDAKTLYYALI